MYYRSWRYFYGRISNLFFKITFLKGVIALAYLMGIDLGTSSLKVIIIDENGTTKALAAKKYTFDSPYNGYAEQKPEVWWNACCYCINEAIKKSDLDSKEIKGISFSGQMHGLVMFDKNKNTIGTSILHCDARSEKQVKSISEALGNEDVKKLVMNPIYTGFLLPSLLWIKENKPDIYSNVKYVCLPKDYLRFMLTDYIASDFSDASATLAFDIKNVCWSKEILQKVEVPIELFPQCYDTCDVVGTVSYKASKITGLCEGTSVVCGGGDQVMQGIGNGVTSVDTATVNIGSSGQVCFQSDMPILNHELNTNTFCGYKKGRWITMGATMSAGLSLNWYRSLFKETDYDELNREINKLKPGSGGLIYLPYLNGERTPHVNPNLSGMLMGLNLRSNEYQLARGIMEGVSYSLMQCIEICQNLGLSANSFVASGGGARSDVWLQIQSDIYDKPLYVTKTEEQACLGAAIAAGVGVGVYSNIEDGCKTVVKYKENVVFPDKNNNKIYKEYYQLFKETYQACNNVLQRVTELGRIH